MMPRLSPLLLVAGLSACASAPRTLVPGPEAVGGGGGRPAPQPYVVRMSDGRRDWEVSFPESTSGYEVRIPLRSRNEDQGGLVDLPPALTHADRELLAELSREEGSELPGEGGFQGDEDLIRGEGGAASPSPDTAEPQPSAPSYLLGVGEVRRLYRDGNPEVAMVRLQRLLESYPGDGRLLAMKGTLWLRLGHPELARRAWEEVLQQDPENRAVQAALSRLNRSGASEDAPAGDWTEE